MSSNPRLLGLALAAVSSLGLFGASFAKVEVKTQANVQKMQKMYPHDFMPYEVYKGMKTKNDFKTLKYLRGAIFKGSVVLRGTPTNPNNSMEHSQFKMLMRFKPYMVPGVGKYAGNLTLGGKWVTKPKMHVFRHPHFMKGPFVAYADEGMVYMDFYNRKGRVLATVAVPFDSVCPLSYATERPLMSPKGEIAAGEGFGYDKTKIGIIDRESTKAGIVKRIDLKRVATVM